MKSDDNIEKFFEKRINDSAGVEEDWNVPSDDIWDQAKIHFPKKKKRRPFIYFLFGAGSMSLLALIVGIYFFIENNNNTIVEKEIPIVLNEKSSEINQEKETKIRAFWKRSGNLECNKGNWRKNYRGKERKDYGLHL